MLLEFTVRNFRSIAEAVTLSMVASDQKARDPETDAANCIELPDGRRVLTSALIYGANASGKSNVYKALATFRHMVTERPVRLPAEPFRLRTDLRDAPTEFEVVLLLDDHEYRYGVEFTAEAIIGEWLFAIVDGEERPLFERVEQSVTVSPTLADAAQLTRFMAPEKLFLWVAHEFNVQVARRLVARFGRISDNASGAKALQWTTRQIERKTTLVGPIVELVSRLDVDIEGLSAKTAPLEGFISSQSIASGRLRLDDDGRMEVTDIETLHRVHGADGRPAGTVRFSLEEHESSGTQKLVGLAGVLIDAITRGLTVIIDELDARLHPNLSRELLALFRSPQARASGAQLIATTHDTHLLDHRTLRRDQIWFTEKNRRGETTLFSLADIKGVRNDERYEKRYLSGRYGGVPFPGDLASVIPRAEEEGDPE